jgi:diguanylate cyclase (GGDEF)-like protein
MGRNIRIKHGIEARVENIIKYLNEQSKSSWIVLGFVLVVSLGVIDYLTGSDPSFLIFYLVPIFLLTWFVGRWTGVMMSVASTIVWFIHDIIPKPSFWHPFITYENLTVKLSLFIIFTYLLSALKNALDREKEFGITDYLTKVANRRFFFDSANIEINKARRYKHPFTIAYLDIDSFKNVNDSFGHNTGDALLRLMADTIKNNVRVNDLIGRLGGDEFALLLPETGYEAAQVAIDRVQKSLLDVMQMNGLPVTCSIGVVTFASPPNSIDEMVKKTDELMYSVKNEGKNSICHELFPECQDTEKVGDIKSGNFHS